MWFVGFGGFALLIALYQPWNGINRPGCPGPMFNDLTPGCRVINSEIPLMIAVAFALPAFALGIVIK